MIPYNRPESFGDSVAQAPQSEPARKAIEHFERTGEFRTEDLRRVLGDIRGIEVGPSSVPAWPSPPMPSAPPDVVSD